jgi:hypothetical protein
MKYIDIKEFREKGYLQELNRQFLHPLGLALEVVIHEDGTESLGRVLWNEDGEPWEFNDTKEGSFVKKAYHINKLQHNYMITNGYTKTMQPLFEVYDSE